MHKPLPSIEILMSRKAKEVSEISYLFHTKNSIPFSQFLRLHRLCSNDSDFPEKSEAMSQFFDKRGYPSSFAQVGHHHAQQIGFCFGFFRGEIDYPPVFLGYHQGNRFKIGKMYEALNAMIVNRLL